MHNRISGTVLTPGDDRTPVIGAPASTEPPRSLTSGEYATVAAVGAVVFALGLIGFVNSFAKVTEAAQPFFGALAWTVPLGIDLGILAFSALDIVLARLDMRVKILRFVPWALTAATIYLNVAGEYDPFAVVAHAMLPMLWVIAVEVAAHVFRRFAGLSSETHMDSIRKSRWLLAPMTTFSLWRRMVLWEIRSYPLALGRERDRVLAKTDLQDRYGRLWRWKATRRERALYKLGELVPADLVPTGKVLAEEADEETVLVDEGVELADDGRSVDTDEAGDKDDRPEPVRPALRAIDGDCPRKPGRTRSSSSDVADLLPVGTRVVEKLAEQDRPLTRDNLVAGLRDLGQPISTGRASKLLALLKQGTAGETLTASAASR
ncbi:DUF2637 domain-containing protein [Planomonospora venezuelensis]|uniref:DUF2637 domain-containing protein n=1 Tax=Planomonospora venezuelensis TaxID=1999 RepID=A0A841CY44_PLAVE|nr:DUF2637 domain-containing protein [Planomonospora venezuelensis]MBB5960865.1 hypothetical protein [Planomonospora venezuelensis]GIN01099.1 hypothetical protein Pve01_27570 [Planomonospora venezuelensis]